MHDERAEAIAAAVTLIVAAALVAAVGVGTAAWHAGQPHGGESHATRAAFVMTGLDLTTVSPDIGSHYHFASRHQTTYRDIPCYCGCASLLSHRHLADCFLLPSGEGWEPHASGCDVCITESTMVRRMLGRGLRDAEIRDRVVAQYESPL
jgi:hypothetical protein